MQISWNGLGSFVLQGKPIAGEVALVTDPYQNSVGLRFPRTLSAALVLESHDAEEANNVESISGEEKKKPFLISHAGEYEVQGIFVSGIHAPKKDGTPHTIFRIRLEDISIAFLGAIDRKLTDKEIGALGDIDILIVPVGGGSVLDKDRAAEVVAQVEPRMVIPSYFHVAGLKQKLADVEGFCKEVSCPREDVNKLKVTRNDLPEEDIVVRVLSRG
ncbi:MAG: MBL fold metallo-hydrolase [Patescibacteria group bacterium]|nr:MBL fold metallo-hydrolase [Patescibacteria group bacterium]